MKSRSDSLLEDVGSEFSHSSTSYHDCFSLGWWFALFRIDGGARFGRLLLLLMVRELSLGYDITIIFLGSSTDKFKRHNKENDADARSGKHAAGGDAPGFGDEAFIRSAETKYIRYHGKEEWGVHESTVYQFQSIEILQLAPPPMLIVMPLVAEAAVPVAVAVLPISIVEVPISILRDEWICFQVESDRTRRLSEGFNGSKTYLSHEVNPWIVWKVRPVPKKHFRWAN